MEFGGREERQAVFRKGHRPRMLDALYGADQHNCARRIADQMHGLLAGLADSLEGGLAGEQVVVHFED